MHPLEFERDCPSACDWEKPAPKLAASRGALADAELTAACLDLLLDIKLLSDD
jgi:hypothetical protein